MSALILAALLTGAMVADAAVYDTTVVSVNSAGERGLDASGPGISVSANGRRIAFESSANNLSGADNDGVVNVYVRDLDAGTTTLVSKTSAGAGADADSTNPSISTDGNFVAFESRAGNLGGGTGSVKQVYRHNTSDGTTRLASAAPGGAPGDGDSGNPSVSENGTYVAFDSVATNLSNTDNEAVRDVFRSDLSSPDTTLTLVSRINGSGAGANGNSYDPSITRDGRRIAFVSDADDIWADDRDLYTNVFVVQLQGQFGFLFHASRTTRVGSVSAPADGNSNEPAISADGGFVAFASTARNLAEVTAPRNVFLHYLSQGVTGLMSRAPGQGAASSDFSGSPAISADGLQVAFTSEADNLSDSDNDSVTNVYVRHAYYGTTTLVSRTSGTDGAPLAAGALGPAISGGGDLVAFASEVIDPDARRTTRGRPQPTMRHVLARELPLVPPPPVIPTDIGVGGPKCFKE